MNQHSLRVVVSGAVGTLGMAVVRAFTAAGASVALIDLASEVSSHLRNEISEHHTLTLGVNLAQPDIAKSAIQRAETALGGIDVLVNVAGGFRWETIENGDVAAWDQMYMINLKTALNASRAAIPALIASGGRGRIINIGAGAATKAAVGMGAYTASKSAVLRLTESLSEEIKDRGVTVNAILPGTIDTPQNRIDMPDADRTRWVSPDDIAAVIVFLASDSARAITGAAIPVFGKG
jgi:NAD(P)-dependent dehydrogenase (short-subunit alcohol dehydrogenase family)